MTCVIRFPTVHVPVLVIVAAVWILTFLCHYIKTIFLPLQVKNLPLLLTFFHKRKNRTVTKTIDAITLINVAGEYWSYLMENEDLNWFGRDYKKLNYAKQLRPYNLVTYCV